MDTDPPSSIPAALPQPGTLEEIIWSLGEVQRQLERLTLAYQRNTDELQLVRLAYDDLSDHCAVLAESLWHERGQSQRLAQQLEWFRQLAGTRAERAERVTPVDGLPPDEEDLPSSPG